MMKAKAKEEAPLLTQKLLEAIDWCQSGINRRVAIDEQVEKNGSDVAAAEQAYREASEALASAEADLALADSEHKSIELEKAADAAAANLEATRMGVERKKRVVDALCRRAEEIDQEIAEASSFINVEKSILTTEALHRFSIELEEALQPMLAVFRRYAAMNVGLNSQQISLTISGTTVPDPQEGSPDFYPMLSGFHGKIKMGDWQSDEAAVARADALKPLEEIRKVLLRHRPFVHPRDRPKPYVRKGYTTEGVTRERAAAAAAAAASSESDEVSAAPMPAAAPRQPMSRSRASAAQPQELNIGAVLSGILPQSLVQS